MNSNELLDALKKKTGIASDYTLARQVLKVDPMSIRDWRKRGLSDERTLQIATLIGVDAGSALAAIHAERAKDPAVRKVWESLVKTLASRVAAAFGAVGLLGCLTVGAPGPAEAAQKVPCYTLCVVRRLRRALQALFWILACFGLGAGPVSASDWTKADTAREAAYLTLLVADWGQTRNIVHRADTGCAGDSTCVERNPFLGSNPSIRRVDSYFALSALTHATISYLLPPDWRRGYQMVTIGFQAGVVGYNYSIGLKMDF